MIKTNDEKKRNTINSKKWELINLIVDHVKAERNPADIVESNFKISRQSVQEILRTLAISNDLNTVDQLLARYEVSSDELNNSILVVDNKVLTLDHNPGSGNYKERYVNYGHFGKVKLAFDCDGTCYAVKVERNYNDDKSQLEREIMREVGLLHGIITRETKSKKNWVDDKPITDKIMLIMPYLTGDTLKDILSHKNLKLASLSEVNKKVIMTGIIDKVIALNKAGIAHRDISPDNVLINLDELPVNLNESNIDAYLNDELQQKYSKLVHLIDYGLACRISPNGDPMKIPNNSYHPVGSTAPECWIRKECSIYSESYNVAQLLREKFQFCPLSFQKGLTSTMKEQLKNYEWCSRKLNFLMNRLSEAAIDDADRKSLVDSIQNMRSKLNILKSELGDFLEQYPPSQRVTLPEMREFIIDHIKCLYETQSRPLINTERNTILDGYIFSDLDLSADELMSSSYATSSTVSNSGEYIVDTSKKKTNPKDSR